MRTNLIFHCFLAWGVVLLASVASGQTLGVRLCAGVSITGTNVGLYAMQANSDLTNSNGWACVGLVTLPATNYFWTDTNALAGQRYYRTVQASTNLVCILPGTFTMGSPTNEALRGTNETQHVVTISKGFYMGKYPVTQGEYLAVTGSNPSHFTGNLGLPVETVSWYDATNYCWLRTVQERAAGLIPPNWAYRLPTESEWEYAARAGTVTAFYLGDALHSQQENFVGTNEYDAVTGNIYNSSGVNLQQTAMVGSHAPNGWGLYDMAGNVKQWCQDWTGNYPTGSVTDPQGPATGMGKQARGGSWLNGALNCRSASRIGSKNGGADTFIGFRVVLAQTP